MRAVLPIFALLVIFMVSGLFLYLGAPYDPERSTYYQLVPPRDIPRTIESREAGYRTTFVRKSHETEGQYTLLEIDLAPGGGNDPHYHRNFDETFTTISGELGVWIEGEEFTLSEGESITATLRDEHFFFNATDDTVTFTVKIEPGSPGFEKSLYILYGISNDGLVNDQGLPENMYHTAVVVGLSGMGSKEIHPLLGWFIRRLAGRAQRLSIEDELIERYYLHITNEQFES